MSSCCTGNMVQRNAANQATAVFSILARCVSNILLGNNLDYGDAQLFDLLHGQVTGEHIASMVQNYEQNAMTFVGHLNSFNAGLGAGSSKNIACYGNINHALANKAADCGLMAGAAQGNDGYAVSFCQFFVNYQIALL